MLLYGISVSLIFLNSTDKLVHCPWVLLLYFMLFSLLSSKLWKYWNLACLIAERRSAAAASFYFTPVAALMPVKKSFIPELKTEEGYSADNISRRIYVRTVSAQCPHYVCTISAQCPHNIGTMSSQYRHNVRTISAQCPHYILLRFSALVVVC